MSNKNKIKPTEKQRLAFENIQSGMSKREAMLKAGYSLKTSGNPKEKLVETRGYQELVNEYRGHLVRAGITPEILADIQAEGLFDQNAGVRLGYLKETKKDFGLEKNDTLNTAIQINFGDHAKKELEEFE